VRSQANPLLHQVFGFQPSGTSSGYDAVEHRQAAATQLQRTHARALIITLWTYAAVMRYTPRPGRLYRAACCRARKATRCILLLLMQDLGVQAGAAGHSAGGQLAQQRHQQGGDAAAGEGTGGQRPAEGGVV
jgi:hypothetical protein